MKGIKTYKELTQIPDLEFEGYVWYSDKEGPTVLRNEKFDFGAVSQNPFVQEALLYCQEKEISVMVRHTGRYHISEIDMNNLPDDAKRKPKEYLPHRLNTSKKLKIEQLWLPEEDSNCEGMEVLTLKAHIFTGFSN